jgi:bla regulator protein blaR1
MSAGSEFWLLSAVYAGSLAGELDKPVVDKTGLDGKFDYTIEWNFQLPSPGLPRADAAPREALRDNQGPTFLETLREQLGLKLVLATGPVRMLVIDHVERPSEN